MQENQLIKQVLQGKASAQEAFYRQFAPKMYAVCVRFARDRDEANDILQEGFIKVFSNLKSYRGDGSLEGWIRRTIVNTAINFYKKTLKHRNSADIDTVLIFEKSTDPTAVEQMSADELMQHVSHLPQGYRAVFNLNVIEGYTHKEIGEMLNISENTSKSQLSRARAYLQKRIENKE
ncbi:MAG: RNA polymerase [Bacteroidetes bacterium 4572_77]|nr:MAG: RNA polymerase [Bacteroidetes bacterium 4572_77]